MAKKKYATQETLPENPALPDWLAAVGPLLTPGVKQASGPARSRVTDHIGKHIVVDNMSAQDFPQGPGAWVTARDSDGVTTEFPLLVCPLLTMLIEAAPRFPVRVRIRLVKRSAFGSYYTGV